MLKIIFYMKTNCPLCDDVRMQLWILQQDYSFEVEERDIEMRSEWFRTYQFSIPVVEVNQTQLDCEAVSYHALEQLIQSNR